MANQISDCLLHLLFCTYTHRTAVQNLEIQGRHVFSMFGSYMACVVWYIFYMICVYSELTWSSCAVQLTGTPEVVTAGRCV